MNKIKSLPLHWKIILGMVLGVLFSLILISTPWGSNTKIITIVGEEVESTHAAKFVKDWIKPFGNIFINALKLIAVPLILTSLIKGISDLKDISKLSKMGLRTILIYLMTTLVAVTIGLVIVNAFQPGSAISEETREDLVLSYGGDADDKIKIAEKEKESGPLSALEDLVPENIFESTSKNENMLQVIVAAIFFGIALISLPFEKVEIVKRFIDGFNEVVLKLIDIIMKAAPFGVFALLATLVVESPSLDLFQALLFYAMCVVLGLLLMIVFYTLITYILTGKKPIQFLKAIFPAQLLGFSTSSSAATLPVTMDRVEKELKVEKEVSSFVLPIGATINMDGTSLYQAVAAIFIAQAFGMDLDFSTQLGIVVTATLASIGSAAVPSAGMVMLVIVLAQAGIPEAGLALIFAIDRPLDMLRTSVNVTGDAAVSLMVGKSMKIKNNE